MYITDEELDDRISSDLNLVNKLEIKKLHNGGRRHGQKNIPPIIREVIAVVAKEDGAKNASEAFDITRTHASRLSAGIVSHSKGVNSDFQSKVESIVENRAEQAHEAALDALLGSIGVVNEKVKDIESPKLASKIASDMARVVSALKPKSDGNNITAQQVLIYAPEQKHIAQYETVDIS